MYKLIKNSNPSVVLYGTYEELEEIKKADQYNLWSAVIPHQPNKKLIREIKELWESQLIPQPIDTAKVRKRVEDALRKNASRQDLILIAGLLNIDRLT